MSYLAILKTNSLVGIIFILSWRKDFFSKKIIEYGLNFALLKESSPSCGSTYIYDGSFTNIKVKGEGVTAELLRRNDIAVYSECNIEKLIQKLLST